MIATTARPRPSGRLPKAPRSSARTWRQARIPSPSCAPGKAPGPQKTQRSELELLRATLSDYQIEKLIGRGANGMVYKAVWKPESRPVAIKVLHKEAGAKQKLRFVREVRAVARLVHPHIVRIYDGGTRMVPSEAGEPRELGFYAMHYVSGADLERLLESKTAKLPFLVNTLAKVARALHFAHQQGFVHRDVKPSNILLDRKGEPHLIDFGFAKNPLKDPRVTELGIAVGTPAYMAPEQALGKQKKLCPASDVFSLGAILYELLTGVPPHDRNNLMDSVKSLVKEKARPPSELNPDTPNVLEQICLCALQKQISQRYSSALVFARDLQSWLEGKPLRTGSPAARAAADTGRVLRQASAVPRLAAHSGRSWREARVPEIPNGGPQTAEATAEVEAVSRDQGSTTTAQGPTQRPGLWRRIVTWLTGARS